MIEIVKVLFWGPTLKYNNPDALIIQVSPQLPKQNKLPLFGRVLHR